MRYFATGASTPTKTVMSTYDNTGNLTGCNDGTTSATCAYDPSAGSRARR